MRLHFPGRLMNPAQRLAIATEELSRMATSDAGHPLRQPVLDAFHQIYYDDALAREGTWHDTQWLGQRTWKTPLDMWQIQEILVSLRPDVVIETGTAFGGSALFMASICDLIDHGQVVSVDITPQPDLPRHDRISYLTGSSVDPAILAQVTERCAGASTTLVVLDSDHRYDHVVAECHAYADLVTVGSYLVVEDTNVNGRPVLADHGPGPGEAVATFLSQRTDFVSDDSRAKFLMSFNPGGWLKRLAQPEPR